MFVEDLDGHVSVWKAKGSEIPNRRSKLHIMARELLRGRFPTMQILEEVAINPRIKSTLFLDFFIPLRKLAIEVQGEQHFKFNTMYHSSRQDFINQRKNDRDKSEWCNINGIELISLRYDNMDEWDKIL